MTDLPSTLPNLSRHPDALPVVKRPMQHAVLFATVDGTCETLEGPVQYRAGDALITGTLGEQWPIARERFDEAYERVSDGIYRKRSLLAYALLLKSPMTVPVGGQCDPLDAHAGDWLLQYGEGDYGVVDADVFAQTYEVVKAPE